jgi:hypothetical protein
MSFDKSLDLIKSLTSETSGKGTPRKSKTFPKFGGSSRGPFSGLQSGVVEPVKGVPSAHGGLRYYGQDPTGSHIWARSREYAQRMNRNSWAFLPDGSLYYSSPRHL